MKKRNSKILIIRSLAVGLLLLTSIIVSAQNYTDWDSYTVDEFYEQIDLEAGTLDEDGQSIDHVYVTSELKEGVYEIEITDGNGDLYEIKNTDYFITFRGYYGYAGYGEEGVLVAGKSSWSSTFYKSPE